MCGGRGGGAVVELESRFSLLSHAAILKNFFTVRRWTFYTLKCMYRIIIISLNIFPHQKHNNFICFVPGTVLMIALLYHTVRYLLRTCYGILNDSNNTALLHCFHHLLDSNFYASAPNSSDSFTDPPPNESSHRPNRPSLIAIAPLTKSYTSPLLLQHSTFICFCF